MKVLLSCAFAALLFAAPAVAGEAPAPPRSYQVVPNLHVSVIENRNCVYLVGNNRVLLAESNFERNAEALRDMIARTTPAKVELVVNTHWHGDHIGGNKLFSSEGALTMSHENTRAAMSVDQINPVTNAVQLRAQAPEFLPTITIKEATTVHWDGEVVEIVPYHNAHTVTDLVLYYRNANAVFVGGLLEVGAYPGIANADSFVEAIDAVLARTNANTRIIPWQGPTVTPAELRDFRNVLATVRDRVRGMITRGMTIDQIIAAKPSADYDAKWGHGRTPERWARDMHHALTNPMR